MPTTNAVDGPTGDPQAIALLASYGEAWPQRIDLEVSVDGDHAGLDEGDEALGQDGADEITDGVIAEVDEKIEVDA